MAIDYELKKVQRNRSEDKGALDNVVNIAIELARAKGADPCPEDYINDNGYTPFEMEVQQPSNLMKTT